MPALSLKLLGNFQAILDDQLLPGFRTSKVQALLIYLVVEPRRHSRESLLELLWPGMPERSARHNLRQILYNLRGAIPELDRREENEQSTVPFLLSNRHMIRLNPMAAVNADVNQFDTLLEKVHTHQHLALLGCPDCRGHLETAVSTYAGEFLEDFYLVDSNAFEEWAQATRQAYRRKALDALEILTAMAMREEDYPQAKRLAERQLEIDNLRESSYRQLMEILARSGHREEAQAVYESCRRLLAEELSMEPAGRTTEIYNLIREGELRFDQLRPDGVRGYDLKEEIGAGTHGAIHRAVQPAINREVAVKVIHPRFANDPEFIRRFEDEAQMIARLEHPYVVPLYDYWRDAQGTYLVMRYMKGGNLLANMADGPWGAMPAVQMLEQIAAALAVAHQKGIIHRDIKPANILFDETSNAYLSDFSIARQLAGYHRLTATGQALGTPDYISPEQILNEPVGPPSDIYSLGAVLYETLTGEKPFGEATPANLIYKHVHEPFPLIRNNRPDLPPEIDHVIQKATAKKPAERYADPLAMAAAVRTALLGAAESRPVPPVLLPDVAVDNPYKGLRPFQETDADDFFGRAALVDRLIARLSPSPSAPGRKESGTTGRFLALVGPSGSGKSSAIKAGLLPALRAGAIPGSEHWFVVHMVPGTHPLEELELALWPVAVDPPPSLVEPMQRDRRGLLRTLRRILPPGDDAHPDPQLLLVIDQFEELFTLVEDEQRRAFFLDSLQTALVAHHIPLRVVITLRADFYDRPLHYPGLGQLLKDHTEVVLPLTADELGEAIREPARRVGVRLEEGLTAAVMAEVADQPGSLPLLQYALTELFDRRQAHQMTRAAYQEIGGVRAALGRRAEAIFTPLDPAGQETARQLFLRLVTLGQGTEDTRRRVPRPELEALADNPLSPNSAPAGQVIDRFGAARLLTFDRDPLTRQPTVEVAHEALFREWPRLAGWLAESREDVRIQRLLARAAAEWRQAGEEDSYLLRGARLVQFADWAVGSSVALTTDEQQFLESSIAGREARQAAEEARRQQEIATARRLAETEKARAAAEARRAEVQAGAARGLRRLVAILAVVSAAALLLAILAAQTSRAAGRNAALAATREVEARQQQVFAEEERATAERLARTAQSRALAAAADKNLDTDPELSLLLALEALHVTNTIEAEYALHQALLTSRVRRRLTGHQSPIQRVAFSPDGALIAAVAGDEQLASIWAAGSGQRLHQIPVGDCCLGLAFDESGDYLVAVERHPQFSLGVWKVTDGEKESSYSLPIPAGAVVFYALAPDGERVAITTSSGPAEIWDLRRGEMVISLVGHEGWGEVEYSQDGSVLVAIAAGAAGRVTAWDAQSGEVQRSFETGQFINDHAVSPDGRWLAIGTVDGDVQLWDLTAADTGAAARPVVTTTGHETIVFLVAFSPDGHQLASAGRDGTARVWDVATGAELAVLHHGAEVRSVAFHPRGDQLLTGDWEGSVRVWDITPQGTAERLALAAHNEVRAAAFNPQGTLLATGGWDGLANIWDPATGATLQTLDGHGAFVGAVAFHPDGRRVASASEDGTVRIWEAETGRELSILTGHNRGNVGGVFTGVLDMAFSPDGERLATAGADGTLRLWAVDSGAELLLIREGSGLSSLAYSPDGRFLATGLDQPAATVVIREAETGAELLVISPTHEGFVFGLSFSPNGRFLATAGGDTTIKIWRLDDEGGQAELVTTLESHAGTVMRVRFSPDGRLLASATRSELRLWDVSQLYGGTDVVSIPELLLLPGGPGLAFSPDSRELVSGDLDGTVRFYLLDVAELMHLAQSRLTRGLTAQECWQYLHLAECPAGERSLR